MTERQIEGEAVGQLVPWDRSLSGDRLFSREYNSGIATYHNKRERDVVSRSRIETREGRERVERDRQLGVIRTKENMTRSTKQNPGKVITVI